MTELPGDDMRPEGATLLTSQDGGTRKLPGRGGVEAQPRPGLFSWTEERLKTLRALWKDGFSVNEIGRRMGVSKNAVVGKVHRLGLPKRPSPLPRKKAEPEKLLTLANLGPEQCRWPLGEWKERAVAFCGEPIVMGMPYCLTHCRKSYVRASHEKGGPFHFEKMGAKA